MSWNEIQSSGMCIDSEEWNDMVTYITDDVADLTAHVADTTIHTTAADEANWNAAYHGVSVSGVKWYAAYKHSANAKNLFKSSSNRWIFEIGRASCRERVCTTV